MKWWEDKSIDNEDKQIYFKNLEKNLKYKWSLVVDPRDRVHQVAFLCAAH